MGIFKRAVGRLAGGSRGVGAAGGLAGRVKTNGGTKHPWARGSPFSNDNSREPGTAAIVKLVLAEAEMAIRRQAEGGIDGFAQTTGACGLARGMQPAWRHPLRPWPPCAVPERQRNEFHAADYPSSRPDVFLTSSSVLDRYCHQTETKRVTDSQIFSP